ncbi:unnamed protein product, partial [Hymenolepis diminuta]
KFRDENEVCQTPTLEPTNAENFVRECNQCLNVAEISHPSIRIYSSKSEFPSNHPGPTKNVTYLTVTFIF